MQVFVQCVDGVGGGGRVLAAWCVIYNRTPCVKTTSNPVLSLRSRRGTTLKKSNRSGLKRGLALGQGCLHMEI